MLTRGFVYLLTSAQFRWTILTSIESLREFHSEPILICHTEETESHAQLLSKVFDCQKKLIRLRCPPYAHFKTKYDAYLASNFDQSIYLDADTRIAGSLDALWTDGLTFVQIRDRLTHDGHPMINAGVIGYGRKKEFWIRARKLTVGWSDQKQINSMYPAESGVKVLDERYNRTTQGLATEGVIVWHWCGKRWKNDPEWTDRHSRHCASSIWSEWCKQPKDRQS